MIQSRILAILLVTLVTASLSHLTNAAEPTGARRPNIVLIMADDMGYSDLGCYGSEIATPNLDKLAAGGLRFQQFYNGARCCPTRAALLTGVYAHQAGIGHMVDDNRFPAYRGFLNDRCVTIAEVLRTAGYRTYMAGKWHVGEKRPHWPLDRGFDRYFGLISGGSNYFKLDNERKMARDDQPYKPEGDNFYLTNAFTDSAVQFLQEHGQSDKPFFLYLAYTAPHWPLHALPEDIARYRGKYMAGWDALREKRHQKQIEMGLVDPKWTVTPRDKNSPDWNTLSDSEKEALDLKMAVYAAQIDRMDQNIGRVLEAIRKSGAEQNTLVMFLSDNGGCAEKIDRGTPGVPPGPKESFLSYGLPWANASNTPFRLFKHWVHEGGISTPMITYWPAVIKTGGKFTSQYGHITDFMATCVDVAGAKYPETFNDKPILPMAGKSLLPIFEGKTRDERTIFWEHEGNRAIRQGKWKLVSYYPNAWELFDMETDRTELKNLAKEQPDRVKTMAALHDEWARNVGVQPWKDVQEKLDAAKKKKAK